MTASLNSRSGGLVRGCVAGLATAFVVLASSAAIAAVPNPIVTGPIPQPVAPGNPTHKLRLAALAPRSTT